MCGCFEMLLFRIIVKIYFEAMQSGGRFPNGFIKYFADIYD